MSCFGFLRDWLLILSSYMCLRVVDVIWWSVKSGFIGVVEADVTSKFVRRRNTWSSVSCEVGLYVRFRVQ